MDGSHQPESRGSFIDGRIRAGRKGQNFVAEMGNILGDRLIWATSHDGQYGRGRGIAVATGMDTVLGSIAEMIEAEPEEATPLQRNWRILAKSSDRLLILCGFMFLLGLGEELIRYGSSRRGACSNLSHLGVACGCGDPRGSARHRDDVSR